MHTDHDPHRQAAPSFIGGLMDAQFLRRAADDINGEWHPRIAAPAAPGTSRWQRALHAVSGLFHRH